MPTQSMTASLHALWDHLSDSPLLYLTLTLIAYQIGLYLYAKSGKKPIVNPVLIAIILLVAVLIVTGTPYERYFKGRALSAFPARSGNRCSGHSTLSSV